jgi:hypothetical protein
LLVSPKGAPAPYRLVCSAAPLNRRQMTGILPMFYLIRIHRSARRWATDNESLHQRTGDPAKVHPAGTPLGPWNPSDRRRHTGWCAPEGGTGVCAHPTGRRVWLPAPEEAPNTVEEMQASIVAEAQRRHARLRPM